MPKKKTTERSEEAVQGDGDGQDPAPAAMHSHNLEQKSAKQKRKFGRTIARRRVRHAEALKQMLRIEAMPRVKRSVHARRSAARCSSRRRATGAGSTATTATRRSRSSTRSSTPIATARSRSGRSASSGSSASTPPPARNGLSYNQFIHGLRKAGIELDRKVLADLAVQRSRRVRAIADQAKAALAITRA